MRRSMPLLIILGVIVLLLLVGCGKYNSMVTSRNNVDNSWAQVQTQYQRRLDLIDNLVNSVQAQVKAENKTLVEVIQARNQARAGINRAAGVKGDSLTQDQINKFERKVGEYQRQTQLYINVVSEQYPDLKSAQAFQDLRTELAGSENRVSTARKDFNDAATGYNNQIQTFPNNMFAGLFGFKPRGLFQASAAAQERPTVPNDFNK